MNLAFALLASLVGAPDYSLTDYKPSYPTAPGRPRKGKKRKPQGRIVKVLWNSSGRVGGTYVKAKHGPLHLATYPKHRR